MKKPYRWLKFTPLIFSFLLSACNEDNYSFKLREDNYAEAHDKFKTHIVDDSFIGDGQPATPPKDIFSLVYYPAEDGNMAAFLSTSPADNTKKYPAVIWLTGGYGGIGDSDFFWSEQPVYNDQSAAEFRRDGLVLMIPSFRGENVNPGRYEMFYGELRDIESARQYLAKLPYVDPNRIYLAGHSTGGTRALLASEYTKKFRAVFSLGGIPDLRLRLEYGSVPVAVPFDQNDPKEFELRSPRTFLSSIKSPTFYFEGENAFWEEFDEIKEIASDKGIPLHIYSIKNGDHFNIIKPLTNIIAEKILNDTGEKVGIEFNENDFLKLQYNLPVPN
ncbi:prolyl oligopeptidase family serine peptidase [Xenorhabdus bovienii]|nr:prolyl oligopeptidase family serine peptidase [Xenorhabdus bovienii]MDE9543278.1 prolyl oligopeptidase family serine peptidase [Xenorhabdus bovienii]MDE9552954.1 prolyl oligopeptidase family serine peptidase [Xenorhabdus bovienii]MDE9554394.1 prolyl oligopeptidase family serine peptidase [Xenorhabdus bovienii]MDE9563618.1 prolyl oligopeptidase family serine peptidase [Xenorhabdus bovienii]